MRVIGLIFLIILSSCVSSENNQSENFKQKEVIESNTSNWKHYKADGIPSSHESYNHIIFTSNQNGYLGGCKTVNLGEVGGQYQFDEEAVLYRTKDQGKSWKKSNFNLNGTIQNIFPFDDTLILFLQSVSSDTSLVVKSTNFFKSYDTIYSGAKSNFIRHISFNNSNNGYIIIDDRKSQYIMEYKKGNWKKVFNLEHSKYKHIIINNKVYSIIVNWQSGFSTGIITYDFNKQSHDTILFNQPLFINSYTISNEKLYLSGANTKGAILIVSSDSIDQIDLVDYSEYIPKELFIFGDTIMTMAYKKEDVKPTGVKHYLLTSYDNGNSWNKETLPDPYYRNPSVIYKGDFLISYSGSGYFQIRN